MTIIVAVKTSSDLVIAADSKVGVRSIGSLDADGNPVWLDQTYDHGVKIAMSQSNEWIAAVAGHGLIGNDPVIDLMRESPLIRGRLCNEQDVALQHFVHEMANKRRAFLSDLQLPVDQWPYTVIIFACSN